MSEEYIWKWMSCVFKRHQHYMARQLEPLGIGMGQYYLVLAVCESPGISQDKLTEGSGVNKSTIARALVQLEEEGYLCREQNPANKRANQLFPTEKGKNVRTTILSYCKKSAAHAMDEFSEEEVEQFCAMIRRMACNSSHSCLQKNKSNASGTHARGKE